eukprot:9288207-Prorocentrum_lima.AAC.1
MVAVQVARHNACIVQRCAPQARDFDGEASEDEAAHGQTAQHETQAADSDRSADEVTPAARPPVGRTANP